MRLIDKNANMNAVNQDGYSALLLAAKNGEIFCQIEVHLLCAACMIILPTKNPIK